MNDISPVVLVIDDEPQIRRFLRAGFDLERFTVLEEETGEAGLRTATLRALDLIVLDLNLPDMDGASIVERVRAWSAVPIIVLSVRASDEDKVRLLEAGADDYVVKPSSGARCPRRACRQARAVDHRSRSARRFCRRRACHAFTERIPVGAAQWKCGHAQCSVEGSVGPAPHAQFALFANSRAQAAPQD